VIPGLWLLAAATAGAAEWRAQLGGEFNADSHGIADVGVRSGELSAELLTDTLDLRWQPESDRGRAWLGPRVATFAGNLLISPWRDGAPAPELALTAGYAGTEMGALAYLPRGLYVGATGHVRTWWFGTMAQTRGAAPRPQARTQADAVLGWWHPSAHAWARVGLDYAPAGDFVVQPHAQLTATSRADGWVVAPRAELRAGAGRGQDELSRTLVGGLNPYVVPLAGAAWGELRMDEYVAGRLGPSLRVGQWQLDAVVDAVWGQHVVVASDPRAATTPVAPDCGSIRSLDGASCERTTVTAMGFGLLTRWQPERMFVQVDAGWAPWLPRQTGPAISAFAVIGRDWG